MEGNGTPHAADRRRHDSGGRSAGRATGSCRACGSAPRIVECRHLQRLQGVLHGRPVHLGHAAEGDRPDSGGRRSGGAGGAGGSHTALAGHHPVGRPHPGPVRTRLSAHEHARRLFVRVHERGPPVLRPGSCAAVPHTAPAHGNGVAAPTQRGTVGRHPGPEPQLGLPAGHHQRRGVPGRLTAPAQREDHPGRVGTQAHRRRRGRLHPATQCPPGPGGHPGHRDGRPELIRLTPTAGRAADPVRRRIRRRLRR